MQVSSIHQKADEILRSMGIATLPVKVEEVARSYGLRVMAYPLEDNVSGILVIENGVGMIGYNQMESRVRRRFTVAHEFGHFVLHKDVSTLFVDKMFRASKDHPAYKAHKKKYEQQANEFAAALLMPESFIRNEVARLNLDLGDAEGLNQLATIFDVSSTAMYFRLFNLHLI
jgi:Zn-dependent peptidase ImmA (M78 family)